MSIDKRTGGRTTTTKSTSTRHQAPSRRTSEKRSTSKRKGKKKKKTVFSTIKKIFLGLLFLMLTIMVICAGYVFAVLKSTPPLDIEAVKNLSQPSSLYDKNGVYMDTVHSEIDRTVVSYDEIPNNLKNAFISIEDQRFESHIGIDPIRIAGSIVTDITKIFRGQSGMHGGSTITQQLLKNTILTDVDFVVERKIKELYLAIKLENELSKDEILNQYLNTIPVGGTSYGVEAGANLYFGKSVKDLNLIECAYIAGITQAPTYYSAYNENNKKDPTPYINRTKTVLSKMQELGKITNEEYLQAIADIDAGKLTFHSAKKSYTLNYEWYINPTISQVKEDLKKKYKYSDEEVAKLLANGGLKINTNMDKDLQEYT
uniref:transglycosylase domain-containing protein n=1 Tax=uncultured Clostridium sp. TaxID=59620 RepID=UPI0025D6CA26